jgi:hypothetical protein
MSGKPGGYVGQGGGGNDGVEPRAEIICVNLRFGFFLVCVCYRSAELRTFGELSRVVEAFVIFCEIICSPS